MSRGVTEGGEEKKDALRQKVCRDKGLNAGPSHSEVRLRPSFFTFKGHLESLVCLVAVRNGTPTEN